MCMCGHCYFAVDTTKPRINKKINKKDISVKVIWVYGPCTVWYISDDELDLASGGSILKLQQMREPHPNIKRVNKGMILFKDQPDLRRKYEQD